MNLTNGMEGQMINHSKVILKDKELMMLCISELNNAKQQMQIYDDGLIFHKYQLAHWEQMTEHNQRQIDGFKELIKKWESAAQTD